ncbi:TRAP transporter substrate-binding protein DctP [candidate division KSB1 bacterium]
MKMKAKFAFVFCAVFSIMIFFQIEVAARGTVIKFATLATEGTTWMNVMKELNEDLKKNTNGEVSFKFYPGSAFGDEKDVLRKMRFGQVHSAGITGMGLGEIVKETRVLELPYLFNNYDEIDYIKEKFFDRFAKRFGEKGYVLLGWAEVGFVYIFTRDKVNNFDDMIKLNRMWVWEGDPLAESTFREVGINPVQLPITDVFTSLQTGLVDGFYTSPLAALALQWFTKVNYMIEEPLTNSTGALLITKKIFNKLTPEQQNIFKEKCRSYMKKLVRLSREDNVKSIETLKSRKIEVVSLPDEAKAKLREIGKSVQKELTGILYSEELLIEVLSALEEYRKNN